MPGMNRRGLFALMGAAVLGRKLPGMLRRVTPHDVDPVGITIRITRMDDSHGRSHNRMDVLYGVPAIPSEYSVRIEG